VRDHSIWLNLEDLGSACYICNASGDDLFETETESGIRVVCVECRVDWPKEDSTPYERIGASVTRASLLEEPYGAKYTTEPAIIRLSAIKEKGAKF